MNIGSLIATLGMNTKDFDRGMKQAETRMQKTRRSMEKLGANLTKYVSLPLAALGGLSFNVYKDFDASMSKITGLVGVARDQVNQWRDDIKKLAPALGKSPTELADAMFFITSAGIRGAKAMEVLEMSGKAAAAGLGETKAVADLVTSAMNAYGKENLNAAGATDVLIATVREGKAEAPELAQHMGMVLPIASQLGVKFDQVGAAIAAMTRTGTDASTASMQLRQILSAILQPSSQAKDAMERLETSQDDLLQTLEKDGLLSAMMKIKGILKKDKKAAADIFPNIRALSGVLDLMGKNADETIKIFNNLENSTGSLDVVFKEAEKTAQQKWNKTMTIMKVAMLEIGKVVSVTVLPILNKVGRVLKKVAEWFNGLNEKQRKFISIIGLVGVAVGPLISIFTKLWAVMMANPIGFIVAGVSALALGIIALTYNMYKARTEQELFNDASVEAKKRMVDEKEEVDNLLRIARDETKSRKVRNKAVAKLNKILPDTVEQLSLENINTKKVNVQLREYNKQTENQIKLEVLKQMKKELVKQKIEEENKSIKDNIKWYDYLAQGVVGNYNMMGVAAKRKALSFKKVDTEIKNITKSIDKLTEEVGILDIVEKKLEGTNDEVVESFKIISEEEQKNIKGIEKLNSELRKLPEEEQKNIKGIEKLNSELRKLPETVEVNMKINTTTIEALKQYALNIENPIVSLFKNLQNAFKNIWALDPLEKVKAGAKAIGDLTIEVTGKINNILQLSHQNKMERYDLEANKIKRMYKSGVINTREKEKMEEALEKKRREALRKRAIQEKAVALLSAIVSTAAAVTEALPNIPMAILVAALGAIEIGVIASTPVPQLATGGEVVDSGAFLVGERGPELVSLPTGAAVTPNHMLGFGGEDEFITRIRGNDLEILRKRTQERNKRK